MDLPEDTADDVERMVQRLDSKQLDLTKPVSKESCDEYFWQLAKLDTLADKYDTGSLEHRIVDELFDQGDVRRPPNHKPPQVR